MGPGVVCVCVCGGGEIRHRNINFAQNEFGCKLDAMSVPEALATTIRILLMFSIVLAHIGAGPWHGRPNPLGSTSRPLLAISGHPCPPP